MAVTHKARDPLSGYSWNPPCPKASIQAHFVDSVEGSFQVERNEGYHLVSVPRSVDCIGENQQGLFSGPSGTLAQLGIR